MSKEFSRRDFLKLGALAGLGLLSQGFVKEAPVQTIEFNERINDILSKVTPLEFDSKGNLIKSKIKKSSLGPKSLSIIPTVRNGVERRLMTQVKLLVVHYDAGERYKLNGEERTALNTVNGLNGNDPDGNGLGPSVHWCIDNFPIHRNTTSTGGYGVLQTQLASGYPMRPYRGLHVSLNAEHPEEDPNRGRTVERFRKLGITSNLTDIVKRGITDFNRFALGYEQIGTKFVDRFPSDWEPPRLQLANGLSLCLAVMKEFGLTPWDIVGHGEIQQKPDPGEYHMAQLRFLIGAAALKGMVPKMLVFGEEISSDSIRRYFQNVADYLKMCDRYGLISVWKQFVGFDLVVK